MEELNDLLSEIKPIEIRAELFKKGNYDFITKRFHRGKIRHHEKQEEALKILTSGKYKEFLYGGAAGGAKTWTGVCWIMFMAINYPNTRYFIARNKLTDLVDSVLVTWRAVAEMYGFTDWNWNGQKHFIKLGNGSFINFIEVKFQPSDPEYKDLGSTEYTCGWIEEIGEIHPDGANALYTRTGRWKNEELGIKKTVFYTCNPQKNWAKSQFYDQALAGTLMEKRFFMQALVQENPYIPLDYIESLKDMKDRNPSMYKRLYLGDWEYEDNPNQLADDEMIEAMFDNTHVNSGKKYITADIARFGSDKAVVGVWQGWDLFEIYTIEVSRTTDIELLIRTLQFKHRIAKPRVIADEDGVGGGVVDGLRIQGFRNASRPVKQKGKEENFKNLQVQCLYKLAEKINNGEIYISADITSEEKKHIRQEMAQIQAKNNDERKLDLKSKSEIREAIGRSPDYRDMMLMRVWFELKGEKRRLATSRPRVAV